MAGMSEQEARVRHERHKPYGFPELFEKCWGDPCAVWSKVKRPPMKRGRHL